MVWARRGRAALEEDFRSSWGSVIEAILEDAGSPIEEVVPTSGSGIGNARQRRAGAGTVEAREAVIRFRRCAVSLALTSEPEAKALGDAGRCAEALLDLADGGRESLLAPILRADPVAEDCTWTVACYEIGDLSPTSLRDFAEAVPAVAYLAGCETPSHVAAELIVTNGDGIRWTALVRSGPDVIYQPFGPSTATAGSPTALMAVRHRWEDQLLGWAAEPDRGLEPATPKAPTQELAQPALPPVDGTAVGVVLGQLLESVRHIEQRLPAPAPAPAAATQPPVIAAAFSVQPSDEIRSLRAELADLVRHNESLQRQLDEIHADLRRLRAVQPAPAQVVAGPLHAVGARSSSESVLIGRWFLWRAARWLDRRGAPVVAAHRNELPITLVDMEQRRSR